MSIKTPSNPPRSSDPPKADDLPSGGLEKRQLSIDEFLEELTADQRGILKEYLTVSEDYTRPIVMRQVYGNQVDWLAYKVQELVESYGSRHDSVKSILLIRLEEDFADSEKPAVQKAVREAVGGVINENSGAELVSPFADTVFAASANQEADSAVCTAVQKLSKKEPDSPWVAPDEIGRFMSEMTGEQKDTLSDYLKVDRDDRQAVTGLSQKYGSVILEVDFKVTQLAETLGCSVDELRRALEQRSRGGRVAIDNLRKKVIINPGVDPRRQETVLIQRKRNQETSDKGKRGLLKKLLGKKKL